MCPDPHCAPKVNHMTEHVPVWVPLGPAAILLNIDIVRRLHLPLYQAAHEEELPTVKLATDENTFCVRKKAAATNLPSTSVEYIEEVQTSNCYKGSGVVYELLCMISVPRSPQYLNDVFSQCLFILRHIRYILGFFPINVGQKSSVFAICFFCSFPLGSITKSQELSGLLKMVVVWWY